jgi:hypothetical protein
MQAIIEIIPMLLLRFIAFPAMIKKETRSF